MGPVRLNRVTPRLPVGAVQSYELRAPLGTHWRAATCEEAGCQAYRAGWRTSVDERLELGQRQAHYIRTMSGRRYTEERDENGLTLFTFEPGQSCFRAAEHRVPLDREPVYLKRDGDWRGNPTGRRIVLPSAEAWRDDFGEHQERIADKINKG